jgi:methylamine--corrinoid protein Co-methyltransferase
MVAYEIVAHALAATVAGADLDLAAVARNRYPEHATGMEARIGAEAGHLTARQGVTREQANEIVKQILDQYEDQLPEAPIGKRLDECYKILDQYEDQLPEAPIGKRLDECYNLETLEPTQEYVELYEGVKDKLSKFGLDYSLL